MLLSNSIPIRSRIGTPSFISKKNVCIAVTSCGLSITCFNCESLARSDYRKGLAETPRLALNNRNRTFQDNGGACGRTAGVDEQDQMSDMCRRPFSAADPHHVSQARARDYRKSPVFQHISFRTWARSHSLSLNRARSDNAICRCWLRSGPGGNERAYRNILGL